jgi:hypothetical protein
LTRIWRWTWGLTVAVVGWMFWSVVQQQKHNEALVEAVTRDDTIGILASLRDGASPQTGMPGKSTLLRPNILVVTSWGLRPPWFGGTGTPALRRWFDSAVENQSEGTETDDEAAIMSIMITNHVSTLQRSGPSRDTVLMELIRRRWTRSAAMLASDRQTLNDKNSTGYSALTLAVIYGDYGLVRQLIANGANPNIRDDRDQTPLFYVADLDSLSEPRPARALEMAELLIRSGADARAVDRDGNPALVSTLNKRFAGGLQSGTPELATLFIRAGASPTARGRDGQSALDISCFYNDGATTEALKAGSAPH